MTEEKIKLFIVDDHQMMIDGIKSLLKRESRFVITGEATRAADALKAIELKAIDVLITDINMPGMGGAELTRKAKELKPDLKVLALSMYDEHNIITEMLDAGVNGYILKNTGKDELINALLKITEGGTFFSSDVAAEMMRSITEAKQVQANNVLALTPRETEIVKLIVQEKSNAQIGEALFISERTVETHRKNIFRKINAKTVTGLVKYAIEQKII